MTSETATPVATHTGRDGKGILITEPAMKQLATLLPAQGDGKVLRVGVRSGGCSGMSLHDGFHRWQRDPRGR